MSSARFANLSDICRPDTPIAAKVIGKMDAQGILVDCATPPGATNLLLFEVERSVMLSLVNETGGLILPEDGSNYAIEVKTKESYAALQAPIQPPSGEFVNRWGQPTAGRALGRKPAGQAAEGSIEKG